MPTEQLAELFGTGAPPGDGQEGDEGGDEGEVVKDVPVR
jgi:hypothetical protein